MFATEKNIKVIFGGETGTDDFDSGEMDVASGEHLEGDGVLANHAAGTDSVVGGGVGEMEMSTCEVSAEAAP